MRWTALLFFVFSACGNEREPANQDAGTAGPAPETSDVVGRENNEAPRFESSPTLSAREGEPYVYEVVVSDPDRDALVVALEEGPELVLFNALDRTLRWTPEQGQSGEQHFVLLASDGLTETRQDFVVVVEDVNLVPRFLSRPERCAARGDVYRAVLEAYDPDDAALAFEVADGPSGMRVEGRTLVWEADTQGPHDVELVVRDGKGGEARQSFRLGVSGFGAGPPPVADLRPMPALSASTAVQGTASSDELLYYELSLSRLPAGDARVFQVSESSVVDGELGRFPASSLANGRYGVRLDVRDVDCNATTATTTVEVTGGLKLGVTHYERIDMEIATGNLNLRAERAYDSKDLARGDFGHGWILTAMEMSPRETAPPGEGWSASGSVLGGYWLEGVASTIEVPMGDDAALRFRFVPRFETMTDPTFAVAEYVDELETGAELTCIDCPSSLLFDAGSGALLDAETYAPFHPRRFHLRTGGGTQADLDLDRGLTRVTDRNGNWVSVSPDAIMHRAGVGIVFEREGGLITAAIGPDGRRVEYFYDEHEDLRRVVYADGTEERYAYVDHLLSRVEDAAGNLLLRNDHDEEGRLFHQLAPTGDENFFDYDEESHTTTITDASGNAQSLHYGEQGEILSEVDVLGHETIYTYDDRGRVTSVTEPDGLVTERTYDDGFNVLSETASGMTTEFEYSEAGYIAGVTTNGESADSSVDEDGNVDHVWNEFLDVAYERDDEGNLTEIVAEDGSASGAEYDDLGRVTEVEDANGDTTSIEYDAYGEAVSTTTPTGITTQERDSTGREVARVDESGARTEFRYDAAGHVSSTFTSEGTREYTYDRLGRVRRVGFPDGTSELTSYDGQGNVIARSSRSGGVTQYQYDAADQLTRETRPDGSTWSYERDVHGEVERTVDGTGAVWATEHDADGRVVRETDPMGYEVRYDLAPMPHETLGIFASSAGPMAITDSLGRTTRFEYTLAGEEAARIQPDGSRVEWERDEMGHIVATRDEESRATTFELDVLGRPSEIHEPNGRTTSFEWLPDGRPTATVDGRGHRTEYVFEGGLLTEEILPLGDSRTIRYENALPVEEIGFDGEVTRHRYDDQGRLLTTASEGHTLEREWGVIAETALTLDGARYELARNSADQVVVARFPDGEEIRYAYDGAGRVIRVATTYDTIAYEYDAAGHLVRSTSSAGATSWTYDTAGRRMGVRYANGASTRYEHNDRDWLTRITHLDATGAIVSDLRYTYDRSGHVLEIAEGDGARTVFTYDEAGELASEVRTGSSPYSRQYEQDLAGNRRALVADGMRTTYEYDENNRLTEARSPSGSTLYRYDNAGRLRAEDGPSGRVAYEYHPITGQLTSIDRSGSVTAFTYDAWGNLREIDRDGTVEHLLVDPLRREGRAQVLMREQRGERTTYNATPYGIVGAAGADPMIPLGDAVGTTRVVLGANGLSRGTILRTAYGDPVAESGDALSVAGFQGEVTLDADLAFVWMGMRTYDARHARFTSRDPVTARIAAPVTTNAYNFAANDPLRFGDPQGTSELFASIVSIGTRIGQAAWSAAGVIGSAIRAVASFVFRWLWRQLTYLVRLRNPGRWGKQEVEAIGRLLKGVPKGGGCGAYAAIACARYLGHGSAMVTRILRLFGRIPVFRASGGTPFQSLLHVLRGALGLRAVQVVGQVPRIATQQGTTAILRQHGSGMFLVRVFFRDAAGKVTGRGHVMFGVGGSTPQILQWVAPAGQTVHINGIYRLVPIRGCSVVVVTTSDGGVLFFMVGLTVMVVVVRKRRRRD